MERCVISHSGRLSVRCCGRPQFQRKLLRPGVICKSMLPPVEHGPSPKGTENDEQLKEQPVTPDIVDAVDSALVESTPSQPTSEVSKEPHPSSSEPVIKEEPSGAAAPQPSTSSHPLEDVPEEIEEDIIGSKELVTEMLDGNSFGKRGEQWFFAQIAALGMLLFPPLTLKGLVDFGATVSLTAGLVCMATAFLHLGRNLSPLPEPRKKHQLVISGIYGYVRHPMYGGLLLAAFGFAVLTRNETRLAILAVLWWILENKVAVEEAALSERYPEYNEYKAKVKKFLPFIY